MRLFSIGWFESCTGPHTLQLWELFLHLPPQIEEEEEKENPT